ncbi:MAG: hypothetical protein JKY50_12875 [Oleispira sp.]|nr:hypothetical protein [Oleispira sp.]
MSESIEKVIKAADGIPHSKLIILVNLPIYLVSFAVLVGVGTEYLQVEAHSQFTPYFSIIVSGAFIIYSVGLQAIRSTKIQAHELKIERAKAETSKAELNLERERNK